jgi:hypothetical protein
MGSPAMPAAHARRVYTLFTQLPQLLERIKMLEQRVADLTGDGGPAEGEKAGMTKPESRMNDE